MPFIHDLLAALRKLISRRPQPQDTIIVGRTAPYLPWLSDVRIPQHASMHAMIVGATRSGKSRLLQSRFLQSIGHSGSVGILEPHFDLSMGTLQSLIARGFFRRREAYEQLIYLDWNSGGFVPFNILVCNRERFRSGDMEEVATVVENAHEAFVRIWPELEQAPMFAEMFTAGVHTLVVNELPITCLYSLLINRDFRHACLKAVKDPLVLDTFRAFDSLRLADQLAQSGSLRRRALLLAYHPATRFALSQPECLNLRQMMDEGVSYILNLGSLRSRQVKRILGAMLLVQIEQAALSRIDLPPAKRRPLTLLVDEWPAFAAQDKSIADILSQAAKYGLTIWLACQSLSQISENRLLGAMENCALTMIFGVGTRSARIEAEHLASVDPFRVKEGPLTETQHAQYLSIVEQFTEMAQALRDQEGRHFHFKQGTHSTKKLRTVSVPDVYVDRDVLEQVLSTYKRVYQRTGRQVEESIRHLPIAAAADGEMVTDDLAILQQEQAEESTVYAPEEFL